jgi:AraC-like DNA-binding protein
MQAVYLSPDRKLFHNEACLVEEMPFIGWTRFHQAKRNELSAHAHPDVFELTYFVHGNVKWWIADKVYETKRGDIFISQPNMTHGGFNNVMHACELYWLHFHLPQTNAFEFAQLKEAFQNIHLHAFPVSPFVKEWFSQLFQLHLEPSTFAKLKARTLFYQIIFQVLDDYQRLSEYTSSLSPAIQDAAMMLRECDWLNPLSMEAIAEKVGLSVSRFHQRFVAEMGTPPAEYRNRERIQVSKKLLSKPDISITNIAHQLGFSSSQYFATLFKKMEGFSPSEYRQRALHS